MGPSPAIFSRTQLQLAIKDISSSHRTPLSISAKHVKEVNSMGSRQEGGGRSHTFVASKNALDIYFFSFYPLYSMYDSNFSSCSCPPLRALCVWWKWARPLWPSVKSRNNDFITWKKYGLDRRSHTHCPRCQSGARNVLWDNGRTHPPPQQRWSPRPQLLFFCSSLKLWFLLNLLLYLGFKMNVQTVPSLCSMCRKLPGPHGPSNCLFQPHLGLYLQCPPTSPT